MTIRNGRGAAAEWMLDEKDGKRWVEAVGKGTSGSGASEQAGRIGESGRPGRPGGVRRG